MVVPMGLSAEWQLYLYEKIKEFYLPEKQDSVRMSKTYLSNTYFISLKCTIVKLVMKNHKILIIIEMSIK